MFSLLHTDIFAYTTGSAIKASFGVNTSENFISAL